MLIAIYGSGMPKVNLALTAESPIVVLNATRRSYYQIVHNKESPHVEVLDELNIYNQTMLNLSVDEYISELMDIANIIKSKPNYKTIIIDRMTDVIKYISTKNHCDVYVFIRKFFDALKSTNLDVILLYGEKQVWLYDKPLNIFRPDYLTNQDLFEQIDICIRATKNNTFTIPHGTYFNYYIEDDVIKLENPTIQSIKECKELYL